MSRIRRKRMDVRRKAFVVEMHGDIAKFAAESEDPEYVAKLGTNSLDEVFVVTDPETDESSLVDGINSGELEVDRKTVEDFGGRPHATVKAKAKTKPKPKRTKKKPAEGPLGDLFDAGETDGN